ncbi:DUF4271 domain-containing protein [Formosa maritima]|uniref:DUF4271 domain-containing protein n=1 Tax=Formosa maritima TaxID=2592046 RepID=A0A5D0G4X9_9FLAO|nr:DUF4271 domain-containing protein [Formosa maritima]TYA53012.1 DUF4271 domain-containing protein [Formosa maritima]
MLRPETSNDLFIILIVVSLIFIALAKLLFEKRFNHFASVLINSSYLNVFSRDQKFLDLFDGLLFLNQIFSVSIFIFISYNFLVDPLEVSPSFIFNLVIAIGIFILIKVLIERLIGSLFNIDNLIDRYLFQKTSYKNFLGLILTPINIILLFSITPNKYLIFSIIIILFFINSIGLLTSFKSNLNLIKREIFYFILYLCALEIGPYIILYKVIIEN